MNSPAPTDCADPAYAKKRRLKLGSVVLSGLLLALCAVLFLARERTTTVRILGLSDASRADDFRATMTTVPGLKLVSFDGNKATASLSYDAPTLLHKAKPDPGDLAQNKVLGVIDSLVGKASNRSFTVTAPTGIAERNLAKIDIKVGLNDCKGCRYAAYSAVATIDGVERASVKCENRTLSTLTAWIDPAKTSKEALQTALKEAGVTLKETRNKLRGK